MLFVLDGIHVTVKVPADLSLEGIHPGIGTRQGNRLDGSVCLCGAEVPNGNIAGIRFMCLDRIQRSPHRIIRVGIPGSVAHKLCIRREVRIVHGFGELSIKKQDAAERILCDRKDVVVH